MDYPAGIERAPTRLLPQTCAFLATLGLVVPAAASAHLTRVPASELRDSWQAPPLVLGAAALALLLFVQAFVRVRRRGRPDHAGWSRLLLFTAGVALGTVVLVSPLDSAGDHYLLSAHMLQHVLLADASPALLLLAVRGPLAFFLLPAPLLRRVARLRPLRVLLRFLLRPLVSFSIWVATMLAWHLPVAYDAALAHPLVHDLEHASFVLAGVLAWTQLVDPTRHGRLRVPGRIAFAFGLLALSHPIVDGLLFTDRPVYRPYAVQPERLLGLSPLADQRIAAAVMLSEQLLTLGVCIGVLLWPLVRKRSAQRRERTVSESAGGLSRELSERAVSR